MKYDSINLVKEIFDEKKILILGFGREGVSTLIFLRKYLGPGRVISIADKKNYDELESAVKKVITKDKYLNLNLGEGYLEDLLSYDTIIKSPGIPVKTIEIQALNRGINVTSQTQLFLDLCLGRTVGVTGTKGKSTTSSLIHKILKTAGLKSEIMGNIGEPALNFLGDDFGEGKIFVFEMSSHQLKGITKSPHIGVLLNIYEEHLDYYEDFMDYLNSKLNIGRFQKESDYLIVNRDFPELVKYTKNFKAKKLFFSLCSKNTDIFFDGKQIVFGRQKIDVTDVNLKGKHNLNNVMAATLVCNLLGVGTLPIKDGLKEFEPLKHRLEKVAEVDGVTFVDDALSTIPQATIAALDTYGEKVGSLILGGYDRGGEDYTDLAKKICSLGVNALVLFPTAGEKMLTAIKKCSEKTACPYVFETTNMKEAVEFCFKNTPKGKICLLSTAAPSFGVFRDYEDKADKFIRAINNLKNISGDSNNI